MKRRPITLTGDPTGRTRRPRWPVAALAPVTIVAVGALALVAWFAVDGLPGSAAAYTISLFN